MVAIAGGWRRLLIKAIVTILAVMAVTLSMTVVTAVAVMAVMAVMAVAAVTAVTAIVAVIAVIAVTMTVVAGTPGPVGTARRLHLWLRLEIRLSLASGFPREGPWVGRVMSVETIVRAAMVGLLLHLDIIFILRLVAVLTARLITRVVRPALQRPGSGVLQWSVPGRAPRCVGGDVGRLIALAAMMPARRRRRRF